MLGDSSLILHMQIALVGIVLVTGLFYLWRSICRIEDKVTRLSLKVGNMSLSQPTSGGAGTACFGGPCCQTPGMGMFSGNDGGPLNFADADAHAKEIMKQLFGGAEDDGEDDGEEDGDDDDEDDDDDDDEDV